MKQLSLILLSISLLVSCGSKENIIETQTVKKTTSSTSSTHTSTKKDTVITNPTSKNIHETKIQKINKPKLNLYRASLEDLLDLYYSYFIMENIKENHYDTLINFYAINHLMKTKDNNFLELNRVILERFSNFSLFHGKNKSEKIATLLNAYNFFTIHIISKLYNKFHNSPRSIQHISPNNTDFKKFIRDTKFFVLAGHRISLNEIEYSPTLGIYALDRGSNPKIKFALGCGHKSCPFTFPQAYRASKLEAQLDFVTKKNIQLERIVLHDPDTNITTISIHLSPQEKYFNFSTSYEVKAFIEENSQASFMNEVKIGNHQGVLLQNLSRKVPTIDIKARKKRTRRYKKSCRLSDEYSIFTPIYKCNQVVYGKKDHDYKRNVNDGHLCISYYKNENNEVTWHISGKLNERDEKSRYKTTEISINFQSFKYNQNTESLTLESNQGDIITKIKYSGISNSIEFEQTSDSWSDSLFNDEKIRSTLIFCHDAYQDDND